jgi:CheY-like chemotaxis protein
MAPLVPDPATSVVLQQGLGPAAEVLAADSFEQARQLLRERQPDLLVTNLRLAAYNGLHLVLIAAPGTRSVVYSTAGLDPALALEAQRRAAFYESGARLLTALPAYVSALRPTLVLPMRDRRNVIVYDRRAVSRGGRRASDVSDALSDR